MSPRPETPPAPGTRATRAARADYATARAASAPADHAPRPARRPAPRVPRRRVDIAHNPAPHATPQHGHGNSLTAPMAPHSRTRGRRATATTGYTRASAFSAPTPFCRREGYAWPEPRAAMPTGPERRNGHLRRFARSMVDPRRLQRETPAHPGLPSSVGRVRPTATRIALSRSPGSRAGQARSGARSAASRFLRSARPSG